MLHFIHKLEGALLSDPESHPTARNASGVPQLTVTPGDGLRIVRPRNADAQVPPHIVSALSRAIEEQARGGEGGILKTTMGSTGAERGKFNPEDLFRAVRDADPDGDGSQGITRERFLQSFFLWGGLHFGLTIDDVITRYGLPSESSETMVAYEHAHAKGPGLILVQTPEDSKLINYVVVHGPGGIDFLSQHNVSDERLVMIGLHKDDILKLLGAPTQNVGELEDGRVCFGYMTLIGIEATSPSGETLRFGLMIYVMFYLLSRDIPFCIAISTQWEPVMIEDLEDVA